MKNKLKGYLLNWKFVLFLYVLITVVISILKYYVPKGTYTSYNNYVIFKNSFPHLLAGVNIYGWFLQEQWDLFKYSPTFAVFMAPFSFIPNLPGLILWNLLNALLLFISILNLPIKNDRIKIFILWFVLQELITSLSNAQSNGLMSALIILTFNFLERRKLFLACLMVVLSIYIKVYGVVVLVLFLFYPGKLRAIAYFTFALVAVGILPILFIGPQLLVKTYVDWKNLLLLDHSGALGMSVMAWIQVWFQVSVNKSLVLAIGALIFCVPLIRTDLYKDFYFRILYLASALLFMVIFNHKAESPTFIIAICGVAIWFFIQEKNSLNTALVVFAFIFTCLSPTDIFPPYVRHNFTDVYILKMFPCLLIWLKIMYELTFKKYRPLIYAPPANLVPRIDG